MSGKTSAIMLAAVTLLIAIQIYSLKRLPGSLVRVYYTAEIEDFNRPPTETLTVQFDGALFDYRIPHRVEQHAFEEIAAALERDNTDSMGKVIRIARWVRERMHFGVRDYSAFEIEAEDVLHTRENDGLRGWCDLYSRLFVITCQSLGIPARIIELDGHVVPEAFVKEAARWIMIDPTFGYYMLRGNDPLSVVELIHCYRQGIPLTPAVFVEVKGDDCLYSAEDEINLREIYLNGFTVVSNQTIDYHMIVESIMKRFTLLIAKVQFLDKNSTMIGSRERIVRTSLALTSVVWIVVLGLIVLRRR
jgi:hypothetical protein